MRPGGVALAPSRFAEGGRAIPLYRSHLSLAGRTNCGPHRTSTARSRRLRQAPSAHSDLPARGASDIGVYIAQRAYMTRTSRCQIVSGLIGLIICDPAFTQHGAAMADRSAGPFVTATPTAFANGAIRPLHHRAVLTAHLEPSVRRAAVASDTWGLSGRLMAPRVVSAANDPARDDREQSAAHRAPATLPRTRTRPDGLRPGESIVEAKESNWCKKLPPDRRIVRLTLKPETDLGDLIAWISSITCRQFVLPGSIPSSSKKVTIVAPQLITPEEAYRLFLSALDSVGLTVASNGPFLQVIETSKAKATALPVFGDSDDPTHDGGYVTRLVRLENADVNDVAQVLNRLKSEQGDVVVFAQQGTLIVTDLASNITRMSRILKELDEVRAGDKIWMVRVKNITAAEMGRKLGEIFDVVPTAERLRSEARRVTGDTGNQRLAPADLASEMMISKIIAVERSNELIVIASERAYLRMMSLVRKLDAPSEAGSGHIHVYYCENANCDELAQTLGSVMGIGISAAGGGRSARARGGAPGLAPTPQSVASGVPTALVDGDVRMNFDRSTNALVVSSSLKDFQALRGVIERLDSPRKQVFVEAMILEVTIDKNRELGGSFHIAKGASLFGLSGQSLLVSGFNPAKTLNPASLLGETMLAGILGPTLTSAQATSLGLSSTTADIPSFGVMIKALQTNSDVDVLSNPHLLIMNNEEGEISVGSRIPFAVSTAGLSTNTAGATSSAGALTGLGIGSLFPQVQREKVALEMKLIPHVNENDVIRLEVDEKISEVAPGSSNLGPSTSERTAKTIVVAKDGQTILIGGLMSDKVLNSVEKVPILGDIPLLGFFFRNSTRHVVKTNLLIALTPYVIKDQSDLRRVLEKKMKERREFVERYGGEPRPSPGADIDYRRKRGMLEEINRAVRDVDEEEEKERVLREQLQREDSGPVEVSRVPGSEVTSFPAAKTLPMTK
jgi:general secretion pathway protein D